MVSARSVPRLLALIAAVIFVAGCSENPLWGEEGEDPAGIQPRRIVVPDLSGDIVFGFGETVFVESEDLTISFTGLLSDSRCPEDAFCFWPGQAEIELTCRKQDSDEDFALLIIQPDRIPFVEPELYECCLGYKIYLLALYPLRTSAGEIPEEQYVAWIRVVPEPSCCDGGSVCFTWTSPYNLQRDPVSVVGASISGDTLTVSARYSGGCIEHWFRLYMQPVFMESNPVQANLYLSHRDGGDACDALITLDLAYDVRGIAELYLDQYGGYDDIVLNVYGYFADGPPEPVTVIYSPE